jgi:large subunit ribosomal protein L4
MKLPVVDSSGKHLREIDVADEVFGIEPNPGVVHQAYVAQMANRRVGGAHTLRRGEVAGSSAKIRRQKGLGRSRQGSIRASHRVGGGVAMGPSPRDFSKRLPKQMRRLAIRSALSNHSAEGTLIVVESLTPSEPRTRLIRESLSALGVERRALVVSGAHDELLQRAARNIDFVTAMPAAYLNVVDLVNAHRLVMTEEAVRAVESLWGGANIKPSRGSLQKEAS